MSGRITELSKDDFDDFVSKNPKVVIDFWAGWCGPCRAMAPMIERLAERYAGKVAFAKVDCDKNPELVKRFRVMGIPTLMFLQGGEHAGEIVGLVPDSEIEGKLREVFSG
ncbi:MAG: thioredoxin [Methanomassiliicoccales archaeon]|nr:thioredoxin [Methanomassiliicoccales archaeon]